MNIKIILKNALYQIKAQGILATASSMWYRLRMQRQEKRMGIKTDGHIEMSELGIENKECNHYGATDYDAFYKMMDALEIRPQEHIFLDYGAGMGRAMILAATYPFHGVFGVDISSDLTDIARRNIEQCRSKLQCKLIDISTDDATKYLIPAGTSVFYFNNPFNGEILNSVLKNIRHYIAESGQPVWVIGNVPPKSAFEEQIRQEDWLELKKEITLPNTRHCLIFSAAPAHVSGAVHGQPGAPDPQSANRVPAI